jgi:hypothetical protein
MRPPRVVPLALATALLLPLALASSPLVPEAAGADIKELTKTSTATSPASSFLSRWSISGGLSNAWTTRHDELDQVGEPDWLFTGHQAKFVSLGYAYSKPNPRNDARIYLRVSLEQYEAPMEYWTRDRVGTLKATVIRVEPFCVKARVGGNSNWFLSADLGGINFTSGTAEVTPGYVLYVPHGDFLYAVREIGIQDHAVGWELFGFGLHYQFPRTPLQIGVETMLIEADNPSITFHTYSGDSFEEDAIALYGLFPLKVRASLGF